MKTKAMSKKLTLSKATISDLDKRGINLVYGGNLPPYEPVSNLEIVGMTCKDPRCYTKTGNPCILC